MTEVVQRTKAVDFVVFYILYIILGSNVMKPTFTCTQVPFLGMYLRLTSEGARILPRTQLNTTEVSSYTSAVVGGIVGRANISWGQAYMTTRSVWLIGVRRAAGSA